MSSSKPQKQGNYLVATAVVLTFVVAYLIIGFLTLDDTTRFVPLLAGAVTLLLLVIDIFRDVLGHKGAINGDLEGGGVAAANPLRELSAILFVAGGVGLIYVAGFLVGIPVYLFASIAYLGRQSIRTAVIVSVVTTASIYLLFEVALAYDLYAGILFK